MNKVAIAFLPMLLLAGFILPGDNCQDKPGGTDHTVQLDGPYVSWMRMEQSR